MFCNALDVWGHLSKSKAPGYGETWGTGHNWVVTEHACWVVKVQLLLRHCRTRLSPGLLQWALRRDPSLSSSRCQGQQATVANSMTAALTVLALPAWKALWPLTQQQWAWQGSSRL